MKSINEYIIEKSGLLGDYKTFIDKLGNAFDFSAYTIHENSITFEDVVLKEDITIGGLNKKYVKGNKFDSLEVHSNGWITLDGTTKAMKNNLNEEYEIESIYPKLYRNDRVISANDSFAKINYLQTEGILKVNDIVNIVKELTVQDVTTLRQLIGTSLEEKVLLNIIDTVFSEDGKTGLTI